MGFLVFDPRKHTTEMADATNIENFKQLAGMAGRLIEEVVAARKTAGRADPYSCPVVHRQTKEVRFFNFNPKYQGRLDHAECCFKGQWRLATLEEEDAEYERQGASKTSAAYERLKLQEVATRMTIVENPANMDAVKTIEAAKARSEAAKPGGLSEMQGAHELATRELEATQKELERLRAESEAEWQSIAADRKKLADERAALEAERQVEKQAQKQPAKKSR